MSPPRTFTDVELGLDMTTKFRTCAACRKQTDAAVTTPLGNVLCGTHYDEWLRSGIPEGTFILTLREGRYRACWEAVIEED